MTYKPSPWARFLTTAASPAAGTTVVAGATAITQHSLVVVCVGGLGTLSTGCSAATVGGTWTRIASITGTGVSSEIWIGYGFNTSADGTSRNVSVTWAGSTKASYEVVRYETPATIGSAPSTGSSTGTGNSTTPDPGTVTPAVGDIVVATACWANVTASSAQTDTPGGKEQFGASLSIAATATRSEQADRQQVTSTTATKRTWTITSGQWAAVIAKIALPSLTETAALTIKGTDTAAADAASVY